MSFGLASRNPALHSKDFRFPSFNLFEREVSLEVYYIWKEVYTAYTKTISGFEYYL